MPETDDPTTPTPEPSPQSDALKEVAHEGVGDAGARMLAADCEKRLDEIADLITRIRHEINNPLTGVLGQAQLLLREDLSESAQRRAKTIEEQAIRIRDIVAQLRQVQKASKS